MLLGERLDIAHQAPVAFVFVRTLQCSHCFFSAITTRISLRDAAERGCGTSFLRFGIMPPYPLRPFRRIHSTARHIIEPCWHSDPSRPPQRPPSSQPQQPCADAISI